MKINRTNLIPLGVSCFGRGNKMTDECTTCDVRNKEKVM